MFKHPGQADFRRHEDEQQAASVQTILAWITGIMVACFLFVRTLRNRKRVWHALPSDPEVLTRVAHAQGLARCWRFTDVYGLDADALSGVERPCAAILLLCPSAQAYTKVRLSTKMEACVPLEESEWRRLIFNNMWRGARKSEPLTPLFVS